MKETRTTCAVEAINGVIGRGLPAKTIFFKFVEYIKSMDLARSIKLRNLYDRCSGTKKKARKNDAGDNIRAASQSLQLGHINVLEFLENIALFKEKKNYFAVFKWLSILDSDSQFETTNKRTLRELDEEEDENKIETQDSSQPHRKKRTQSLNLCLSCDLNQTNLLFMPCKHAVLCSECWDKRNDDKYLKCHAYVLCPIEISL